MFIKDKDVIEVQMAIQSLMAKLIIRNPHDELQDDLSQINSMLEKIIPPPRYGLDATLPVIRLYNMYTGEVREITLRNGKCIKIIMERAYWDYKLWNQHYDFLKCVRFEVVESEDSPLEKWLNDELVRKYGERTYIPDYMRKDLI